MDYSPNKNMEKMFRNTGNRETNEPNKFHLSLPKIEDLRISSKNTALQNFSIYYVWKNMRQQYKNNKLKIKALTWNDEFELSGGSYLVSNIHDYMENIIKRHYPLILLFIFTSTGLIMY